MPDHYFTPLPQSEHKPARLAFSYRGHALVFDTDSGVFSRLQVDKGSELLLHTLPEALMGRVLDMGCGYGAIGLSVAKAYPGCSVTLADINERAVALAEQNAKANGLILRTLVSDGFEALKEERFDWILLNPPIRAGKQVIYGMFADAARCLSPRGELWLVIRKQQGAPSAMEYLKGLFAQVQAVEKKGGYWILRCREPLA
ncbi:MAG: class I SAM-dependent methyltransferase [Candidatus Limiplasma sp.]|nr:class I SAM-dependent methyltransferase [Candidatus Limiplasma sp.]